MSYQFRLQSRCFDGLVICLLVMCFVLEIEHFENIPKFYFGPCRIRDRLDDPGRSIIRSFFAPGFDLL